MMQMMFAIDRDNFDGQQKVTCNSCHRGSDKPLGMPIITGDPPVQLYFDKESGLLVRLVRYVESPLGCNPVQTDYFDYR